MKINRVQRLDMSFALLNTFTAMLNILAGLVLSLIIIAISVRTIPAEEIPSAPSAKPAPAEGTPAVKSGIDGFQTNGRWREGTRLHQVHGVFTTVGDRLQFTANDGKVQLLTTENLLAERVMRSIQESSDPLAWVIQGTMTEFKGNNYLTLNYASILAKKPKLAAKEAAAELRAN
jgi:hypothetical protein